MQRFNEGLADRFSVAWRSIRKDGISLRTDWIGSVLRDSGKVSSYLLLIQYMSARVSAEQHPQHVANRDVLRVSPIARSFKSA